MVTYNPLSFVVVGAPAGEYHGGNEQPSLPMQKLHIHLLLRISVYTRRANDY